MFGKVLLALVALSTTSAQSATLGFYDVARLVHPDSKSVFAGMQLDAYIPDASLVRTIDEFISIPGDENPVQFGPYAMIDGCRRQSCIEKAAIIVDMRSRSVAAVGLRNYECRHVVLDDGEIAAMARDSRKRPPVRCNDEPILDIYVVRRSLNPVGLQDEREQLAQLRKWGSKVGHQGERVKILARYKSR